MDFPTVATAAGLVGNAISALKNARELAKDTSNDELNAKINAFTVSEESAATLLASTPSNEAMRRFSH